LLSFIYMKISLSFIILVFSTISILVSAQGILPEQWTLQDCVAQAIERNITVQRAKLQVALAGNNLDGSRWSYTPNLNLGTSYFWNFGLNIDPVTNQISQQSRQTANFNLSSNWSIYEGGRKYKSIARDNYSLKASRLEYESAKNDISLAVVSNYLQILLNKEIQLVALQQVRISDLQVRRCQKMVDAGSLPQGDLLQLQAQLARDQQNLIASENSVKLSQLQMANLLLLDDPSNFDVSPLTLAMPEATLISTSPAGIYNTSKERQPAIKSAEARVQVSELNVDIAQAAFLPSLSLIAQVGTNYSDQIPNVTGSSDVFLPIGQVQTTGELVTTLSPQSIPTIDGVKPFSSQIGDNLNQVVGINFSVPIFNNMSVKNNVQNAKINADVARLNVEDQKNSLKQDVYQSHADAKAAFEQYKASEVSVSASQEAFNYAKQRFEVGAINQLDFESGKNNLASAKSQFSQAKYDYIFKIKVLEFYLTNKVVL
jgi:outer membrane protein